ncbi:HNH endonuclease [bacterium]|nr:HNH endonuclease [bacterium]
MKRALLLNSDWSPLNFISDVRALSLLFRGRAEVISVSEKPSIWDETFRAQTACFDVPATIRLIERVSRKHTTPRFRRKILFNRDNWQCQYCSARLDWKTVTIDHVHPRCKGGRTSWKNCVTSCKDCNLKKGPKTLLESGMKLRKSPSEPHVNHFWETQQSNNWHPDWDYFFSARP